MKLENVKGNRQTNTCMRHKTFSNIFANKGDGNEKYMHNCSTYEPEAHGSTSPPTFNKNKKCPFPYFFIFFNKSILKGAKTLHFIHYPCVVIILFKQVYISLNFTQLILEN